MNTAVVDETGFTCTCTTTNVDGAEYLSGSSEFIPIHTEVCLRLN